MQTEPTLHRNLLTEPLISVRLGDGTVERSDLPGVLTRLSGNGIGAFTALAAHQRQSWYCLLVQLSALALHRAGISEPPGDAGAWRTLLQALTPDGGDAPWCLVADDPALPAFLQPPVRAGGLAAFKNRIDTPDGLDILVTAKDHDVKLARIVAPRPEHWLYALVNLQTMQGFLGRGNYGIVRMNGGFASRPRVGRAPSVDWAARYRRDLAVLRDGRAGVLTRHDAFAAEGGLALLWLEPWDAEEALPLGRLDPWCVEVCRRVRLVGEGGRIQARTRPSNTPRVVAPALGGNVGDPWIPLDEKGCALTVSGSGFDYRLMTRLLGDLGERAALAQCPHPDDPGGEVLLCAEVLVRGQGKTDGLHERVVAVPAAARSFFDEEPALVGEFATRQVKDAGDMRLKVLKPALLCLLQGGPDDIDFKDRRADPWLERFDRLVDDAFFPALWQALEDGRAQPWRRTLGDLGRQVLLAAEGGAPIQAARVERAVARAERLYGIRLHKLFGALHAPDGATAEEEILDERATVS